MTYAFGDYELEPQRYELRYLGVARLLEPQVLEVLAYLIRHRNRVVTKEELVKHLWPTQFVSDATLHQRLSAARKAVGDNGHDQHTIKTIRGRGYRFAARVEERTPLETPASVSLETPAEATQPLIASHPSRVIVGRETELDDLHHRFALARGGERQIVFISGEAGIGKTALVDAFVARTNSLQDLWVGHGQCIEQYGAGEPYLPLLEALGRLCREAEGMRLLELLHEYAPSWLVQMPTLLPPSEREALNRTVGSNTQIRMLRELTEALDRLTVDRPLVLILEDLHWSDTSTLEWLAYVARRQDPARLLILGTYRPAESMTQAHSLRTMIVELRQRQPCQELALNYLSNAAVTAYLTQRLGLASFSADFADMLYQRTNGNPLFLTAVVNALISQKLLEQGEAGWGIQGEVEALTEIVPESIQLLAEQYVDQLSPEDQAILEAASITGHIFAIAAVAAGLGQPESVIEARCATWNRQGRFIQAHGIETWPDGTVSARYRFIHALYHEVVYKRPSEGLRTRLHHQIGLRKESGYGVQSREIAAELAMHFERGREPQRALRYLHIAGENALQRSAHQEGIAHLMRGLEMLQALPDTPERIEQELSLRILLGPALITTRGYGASEVGHTYTRAYELCQQMQDTPQQFPVLWGLWQFYNDQAALDTALDLGEQLFRLSSHTADPALRLQAHHALETTLFWRGDITAARKHQDQSQTLYDAQQHRFHAFQYGGHDPGVCCHAFASIALWVSGYPDQARQRSDEALALAQTVAHPGSLAHALAFAVRLHVLQWEWQAVYTQSEALITLASAQGFSQRVSLGHFWSNLALAERGLAILDLGQLHQDLTSFQSTGVVAPLLMYYAQLAQAYGKAGQPSKGLTVLSEALAIANHRGVRDYEAELYRLKGDLLLALSPQHQPKHQAEATRCFYQALDISKRQQARAWELRAATSLARLWQNQGKPNKAHALLAPIYSWFTEGFNTTDLQDAKQLLDGLSA